VNPRTTIMSVVLLSLIVALTGCTSTDEPAVYEAKEVQAQLVTAARSSVPRTIMATGSLEAENTVQVSTRLMGHIKEVLVRVGQKVEAGDVLVRIDDTDMQARLLQTEAAIAEAMAVLDNAETNLARFERLFAENSVSRSQLDEVRTGHSRAQAGLMRAQAAHAEVTVQLNYLNIQAPTDGTVTRRQVDPGDMANPGQPLLSLEQAAIMKVVAGLGERDVDLVDVGAEVRVKVASLDQMVYTVPVARIIPAANPMSRTFDLEAYIPNDSGRLKSGMFARVEVTVGSREAVLVPAETLHKRGQLTGVWLVDDQQTIHLRWIRIGREIGDEVEVISGLEGGERLILQADVPMVEGDKVVN